MLKMHEDRSELPEKSHLKELMQLKSISNKSNKIDIMIKNPIETLGHILESLSISDLNNNKHIAFLEQK